MVSISFVDHRASKSTSKQRYPLCKQTCISAAFPTPLSKHTPKFQTYERSNQAKVGHSLLIVVPLGESAKRTTLVCAEERHAVDVTCVHPAETS